MPSETSLNRLRTLLLGATEEQIETIHTRLGDSDIRVQELSQDLPAALIHRAQKDNQLAQALLKTVEGIVQTSVERDPQPMVNAIYPAIVSGMLTAIRDFAHDSFQLDKDDSLASVEIGDREIFVVQGPKAVLAALVWGTPPDIFRKTLHETLEEIHLTCATDFKEKESDPGAFTKVDPVLQRALLIEERSDTHRVSMITWLFLFGLAALIGYGGYVWWTRSQLWSDFQSRLDQEPGIVVTSAERNWGGYAIRGLRDPLAMDPHQLAIDSGIDPELIESQWEPYQALTHPIIIARARKLSDAPDSVTFEYDGGVLQLSGEALKEWDEKARPLLTGLIGVDQIDDSKLTLYTPLELMLREACTLMELPEKVSLGILGKKIAIQGEAPLVWYRQFDQLFRSRFEPETLDVTQLTFEEQMELQEIVTALAGEEIYFVGGGAELAAGDGPNPIPELAKYIGQMSELADLLGQPFKVEIKGKTDIRGSAEYNHALSLRRAETIRSLLIEEGVPADVLIATGQSVEELLRLKARGYMDKNDRRVEFTVINK